MIFNCPGAQRFKQPHPETMKCRHCGAEVEMWSDEVEVACKNCTKRICRIEGQSCLDWCKYAKECVGDEKYGKYMKNKKGVNDVLLSM